jgi:SWI/SNF-related matrix-associated actin-dependent regulator 1 of chromatin subfamily A
MADSTVSIGADLSELRRELAKLPNLSTDAAQKTLIQIEKAVQKAEKAAKKTSKEIARANKAAAKAAEAANKTAGDSLKDMGDTAGDTESSIRAISGALGMISPEAESALNVIAELGGGLEGVTKGTGLLGGSTAAMGVAVGAAAAIAAAAYVTWKAYNVETERAAFLADAAAAAELARAPILDSLVVSVRAMKVITGELTEEQAALETQAVATFNALNRSIDPTAKKIKDLKEEQSSFGTVLVDTLEAGVVGAGALGAPLRLLTTNSRELAHQVDILESSQRGVIETQKEASTAARELTKAQFNEKEAAKNAAAAKRNKAEAAREAAAAAREEAAAAAALAALEAQQLANAEAYLDAVNAAAAAVSGATAHRLSDLDKLNAAEAEAVSGLISNEAATQEQIQAIREEFALRREELYQKETDLRKELSDKSTADLIANEAALEKAAIDAASAKLATVATVSGGISELADMVSANQMDADEKTSKRQRALALRAFKVSKALSLSQTAVLTAQALMVAMATVGTPQRIAAVAAATATGAVSLAKIAGTNPPTFHTGGVVAAKPGEVGITAQAGEAVLSREMVAQNGGPDEVMQRAAEGFGAQSVTVDFKLRHRSLDRITTEVMRAGGAASEATRGLRPSGFSNPYTASR